MCWPGVSLWFLGLGMFLHAWVYHRKLGINPFSGHTPIWQLDRFLKPTGVALVGLGVLAMCAGAVLALLLDCH